MKISLRGKKFKKSFQKNSKHILSWFIVIATVISLITFNFGTQKEKAQAATYSFAQNSWTGGATSSTAADPTNRTGWNEYSAKDANLTAGSTLQLSQTTSTANINFTTEADYIQEDATNGTDFSGGVVKLHDVSVAPALNPNDKNANIALSNGNLTASSTDGGASWKCVRANVGKSSGKWYWEATQNAPGGNNNYVMGIGVANSSASLNNYCGADANGWMYSGFNGNKFNNASGTSGLVYGSVYYNVGDVIGVSLDMDAGTITMYKNGVSQGVMYSGLSGTFYPAFNLENVNLTVNFGATAFTYTVPDGYSAITASASYPVATDSDTKLLFHADGTNGSTSFTDSSSGAKTVTANGNAQVSTVQSKFGGASVYFDNNLSYLTVADSDDWDFGSGNFTVETWADFRDTANHYLAAQWYTSGQGNNSWALYYYNSALHFVWSYDGNTAANEISYAWTPTLSTLYHIAVVKNGTAVNLYISGTSVVSGSITSALYNSNQSLYIGASSVNTSSWTFYGYIDEFRVSKGIARWTSNFTPPTTAYANGQSYYITTANASQIDTSTWSHISGVTLTQTTSASTSIKYLVSFDGRTTWKYWNGSSWIASSLDNLQTNGMTSSTLQAITQSQWEASGGFVAWRESLNFAADFATTDSTVTPSLDNIAVSYSNYSASQTLTLSAYNTGNSANLLSKIQWTATTTSATSVKFQIRTSPDNITWTDWLGPNNTSSTYFTSSTGTDAMPSTFTSGSNDQYFQYKAFLTSDGTATPTLSSTTITYVVNAPPNFDSTYGTNGVTVVQNATSSDANYGKVQITYKVRDADTLSGSPANQGYITPSFQYNIGGGWINIT
ncbi:MAG: hypothetical protein QMD86_01680, partial [Patescibacteria group bacterium]|nr:hypothetical protein [Patescibacteria group bacterium]